MAGGLGYRVPVLDRFWAKVEKGDSTQCWEWRGMLAHGYGYLWVEGKMVRAHRLELFIGAIPEGRLVMHRCDNRAPTPDGSCLVCRKQRKPERSKAYAGRTAELDPFCSCECARVWYANPIPERSIWSLHHQDAA